MKYHYTRNDKDWKHVNSIWHLKYKCSIFGTSTWCIDDCPLEDYEKHKSPEKCNGIKKRRGVRELFFAGYLFAIIKIYIYFSITINIWTYQDIEGSANGKVAKFRIAIVTQEYRWKFASSDSIETGQIRVELPKLLNNIKGFNHAKGIITAGTASQEGTQEQEVIRADRRADNILLILRTHDLTRYNVLYKLNLGQHLASVKNENIDMTSIQRRVIIIAILGIDPKMSFEELRLALQRALSKSELNVSISTQSYSYFDFQKMN